MARVGGRIVDAGGYLEYSSIGDGACWMLDLDLEKLERQRGISDGAAKIPGRNPLRTGGESAGLG